jgi:2-iminobutanoate/2-iminopropanoate deaminase
MLKKIETNFAPKAIGPYSQAVATEQFLFVSGQIPIEPDSGLILDLTIQGQTDQVLDNIAAILKEAGLGFQNVVKVEIYVKDLNDFQAINALYAKRFFHEVKPARQFLEVARLPLDSLIEISCIASFSNP